MATALGISPSFIPTDLSYRPPSSSHTNSEVFAEPPLLPDAPLSSKQFILGAFCFTLVGCSQLFVWNVCLNTLHNICATVYQNSSLVDTLIALYQTANVLTQFCLMVVGGVRPYLFLGSSVLLGILAIVVALVVNVASANTGQTLLYVLMLPLGSCVGNILGCGFTFAAILPVNFCGYVAFGNGLGGIVSFGFWMIFSKVVWNIYKFPSELPFAVWSMFAIAACVSWFTGAMFLYTIRTSWAAPAVKCLLSRRRRRGSGGRGGGSVDDGELKKSRSSNGGGGGESVEDLKGVEEEETTAHAVGTKLSRLVTALDDTPDITCQLDSGASGRRSDDTSEEKRPVVEQGGGGGESDSCGEKKETESCGNHPATSREADLEDSEKSNKEKVKELGWVGTVRAAWVQLFCIGLSMWITLMMFPVIGPLSWLSSDMDVIMGMFQIGDFIGRYVPNAGFIPYIGKVFMMPQKFVIFFAVARVVFVPLFMLCYKLPEVGVFVSMWYQVLLMLAFSVSNGWCCTLGLIYCPNQLKHGNDKAKASLASSVVLMLGIVAGLWMSKLYKL
eukprot:GHVS01022009.1.p1 GENE.GHVS01022009.1~~GHVS01022009.1.p1  ORF type:complete len:558 (+),score=83.31 GHVS01022009.1:196-1869(+)